MYSVTVTGGGPPKAERMVVRLYSKIITASVTLLAIGDREQNLEDSQFVQAC